jgi:hypothetical protein
LIKPPVIGAQYMPAEFIHDGTFLQDESQSSRSPLMTFGSGSHRDQPQQRERLSLH